MTMRFYHQSYTQFDKIPGYREGLEANFKRAAAPGTEVVLHGMDDGTYNTDYPGTDISFPYIQHLHSIQILEHVLQAEAEGYDAFLLSTLPDPYLEVARSVVDIPVVGFGFSSMHAACHLGRRFGIVCFIEGLMPYYADNARKYGLGSLAGPVAHLGLQFHDVLRGFEKPGPVVDAFTKAVRGLAAQGVDVVIPGEAPLHLLLQQAGIQRVDEIPVVDGLATTLKTAEMMVGLRRCSGMQVTRAGYFTAKPPRGRIDELLRFYRGNEIPRG
jgi:Asp/Glu/hydantoin racemase